jgi:hypothetical protein
MPEQPLTSAEAMDRMTPNERAAIVDAGVLQSIDQLPEPFRSRVIAKAAALEKELQQALPEHRSAAGRPSATDFLLFDLPRVRDQLASNFEGCTSLARPGGFVRVYIGSGAVVPYFVLYVVRVELGVLEVVDVEISID